MNKKIIAVLVILALIATGVVLVKRKQGRLARQTPPESLAAVVEARTLEAGPVTLTLRTTADVQALRDGVVASRLTAYLTELPLFEGDRFKRGDLLARLDMTPAEGGQTRGGSLAADLAAAESSLKAEQERLARNRALYRIEGVSLEQLQSSEAAFAAARARHAAARENLRNATVHAPFAGVVSQRLAQPGDLVTPGKPILKIIDDSAGSRLLVSVPETMNPAALQAAGLTLPLRPWPEAGPQGVRRFEARTPAGAFVPGTRIDARVVVFRADRAVFLPRACLLNDDGRTATVLALADPQKVEAFSVVLAGTGEEGAAALDARLAGRRAACASPDILARLAAGVPFRLRPGGA